MSSEASLTSILVNHSDIDDSDPGELGPPLSLGLEQVLGPPPGLEEVLGRPPGLEEVLAPPPGLEQLAQLALKSIFIAKPWRNLVRKAEYLPVYPCTCDNEQDPTYRTWPGKKCRDGSYDMRKEENWSQCKMCGGCECGHPVPKYCKLCDMWTNGDIQYRNHLTYHHHRTVARGIVEQHLGQSINDFAMSLKSNSSTSEQTLQTMTLQMETILEDHPLPDIVTDDSE